MDLAKFVKVKREAQDSIPPYKRTDDNDVDDDWGPYADFPRLDPSKASKAMREPGVKAKGYKMPVKQPKLGKKARKAVRKAAEGAKVVSQYKHLGMITYAIVIAHI